MSTYSSIRIYISSNASILPKGFYDIIGYVGEEITPSSGFYNIDNINNFPVVQSGIRYYKLVYYSSDGYRPTSLDNSESLHLLVQDTAVPIYQSTRDDAHLLTSADYPINANIGIVDVSNLYLAYREYTMDVYQDYAIKNVGTIYDSNNIIDVIDSDFILVPTNTDEISITPEEGLVESLYTFTLTFQTEVLGINRELINKISLYDGNTNNIAISVDVNSINQTSSTTITFSLLSNITSPSTYYLYLPTGLFYYSNGSNSAIAIFAYSIRATEGGGEIGEYIQNPTQGKELRVIKLTFPNISTVFGLSTITQISLTDGSVSESWDSGDILSASGNVVTITLPNTYINSGAESVRYTITIPANTIAYTTLQYNNSPIILYYDLLPEGGDLPTGSDEYSVNFLPVSGNSVYSLSYLNIFIHLANRYGLINVTDGRSLNEIFVKDYDGNTVGYVRRFEEKTPTTEGEHLLVEFDCSFDTIFNSSISYTIIIPEGLFSITSVSSGVSTTLYNPEWTLVYNIIQENPDTGQGTDSVSFYHNLIKVQGTEVSENIAFKVDDTIYINRSKLASISTWPILSITKYDEFGSPESKELLMPSPRDIINVSIRATYYNTDNVLVSTTNTVDYGYIAGDYNRYDVLRQLFREIGTSYPNYLKLHYSFTYNQQVLEYDVELQIIPNVLFLLFKNNQNLQRNVRIDLYSGSLTDIEYGCLLLTGEFDSVLSYEDAGTIKYVAELVPTTKVRTGNLSGIYNYKFGDNQPNGFGLYGENVFLTGNFYLNNGKSLMDISDDVLLANGNIKEVEDGLKNLDTSVKATIEALTEKQENFEAGLDTSIKNYISTNKNAVLKIGLDYSIWALGSAGITMVNPNATYDFDPITGNYSVNPDTVGDGNEYISLQGSKIVINTYCHDWLVDAEDDTEKEFQEVIATTVNPELWEYDADGSIYIPKRNGVPVAFIRGYVESLQGITMASVSQTEETHEMLKYANFWPAEIKNSKVVDEALGGFRAWGEPNDTTEVYAFTTFYMDTGGSHRIKVKREYDGETTLVNLIDYADASTVYFVPRLEQSGLFKDGKFNSKYIEAENLVAVDIDDDTYTKNRRFDPTHEITDTNYPVLLNDGTSQPAKDANFVVVSGTTGKLTAKGADIRGSITIGDHETDGDTYVAISDNKGDHKIEDENYPALYILKHHVPDKNEILAKFSGNNVTNVASLYSSVVTRTINRTIHPSIIKTYTLNSSLQYDTMYDDDNYNDHIPYYEDDQWGNTPGTANQNTPHTHVGTPYYWYHAYYNTTGSTSAESPVYYTQEVASFDLGPNESKTIALEGNLSIQGSSSNNSRKGQLSVDGKLFVRPSGSTQTKNIINISKSSAYTTGSITVDNSATLTLQGTRVTLKNDNGQNSVTYEIILLVSVRYDSSWDTNKTTGTPTQPSGSNITVTASATLEANYKIQEGGDGYVANFFGNGLAVGFNALNNFHAYYVKGGGSNYWWDKDRMRIAFKASGIGMSFEDGQYFQHLADHQMTGFIPILVGMIRYNEWFYYFEGRSLMSNGYYSSSYSNDKIRMQCPPYYSNHFYDASWWEELWGGSDTNYQGLRVNTSTNSLLDTDAKYNCIYNSTHDIYIVRVSYGIITILFGEKWNSLFSAGPVFLSSDAMKISTTGIGKDSWNGSISETTRVPIGSMFITAKPPIVNSNGIQVDANRKPALFRDSNTDSVYNVTYGTTTTNTPKFCNAFCFNLADDSALNDGSFYLCLEVCPNAVTA